jgi:hypothetical protein
MLRHASLRNSRAGDQTLVAVGSKTDDSLRGRSADANRGGDACLLSARQPANGYRGALAQPAHYPPMTVKVNIRMITVGNRHAEPGDPTKVASYHRWLLDNPDLDLPAIDVRVKPNGTYRIHDGRHRFLAYVLAERDEIPIILGAAGSADSSVSS